MAATKVLDAEGTPPRAEAEVLAVIAALVPTEIGFAFKKGLGSRKGFVRGTAVVVAAAAVVAVAAAKKPGTAEKADADVEEEGALPKPNPAGPWKAVAVAAGEAVEPHGKAAAVETVPPEEGIVPQGVLAPPPPLGTAGAIAVKATEGPE